MSNFNISENFAGGDCFKSFGIKKKLAMIETTPSAATAKNVARHPNACQMNVPSGTPMTVATVKPVNMRAMALAFLCGGTSWTAMVAPIEKKTP